eukprot:5844877-Prymnesium_polylepis.1
MKHLSVVPSGITHFRGAPGDHSKVAPCFSTSMPSELMLAMPFGVNSHRSTRSCSLPSASMRVSAY